MALSDVLKGLRELILDQTLQSYDNSQLRTYLFSKYPDIMEVEFGDLLALPKERLSLYTRSIYVNQKKVISKRLPRSVFVFEKYITTYLQQEFVLLDLVKDMYSKFPWEGNQTITLLRNFVGYILETYSGLLKICPYFKTLAEYELARYSLIRDPHKADRQTSIKAGIDFTQCTVSELLGFSCKVNSPYILTSSNWDICQVSQDIKGNNFDLSKDYSLNTVQEKLIFRNYKHELVELILSQGVVWSNFLQLKKSIGLSEMVEMGCPSFEIEQGLFFRDLAIDLIKMEQSGFISLIK